MPNNPRQQIKHDLDRADNHLDWAQQILANTGEKYRKDHPEITEQYQVTYAMLGQCRLLIEGLRDTY